MKRLLILLAAVVAVTAVASAKKASKDGGKAAIKFTQTMWDFGTVKKDKPATHVFEFTNTGTDNLVILEATAECGCTRPEYSEKPIAPGKKGSLKVSFNPIGRAGSFEKTITVRTNGNPKKVRLKIRGVIMP